jgi:hypothetical protein
MRLSMAFNVSGLAKVSLPIPFSMLQLIVSYMLMTYGLIKLIQMTHRGYSFHTLRHPFMDEIGRRLLKLVETRHTRSFICVLQRVQSVDEKSAAVSIACRISPCRQMCRLPAVDIIIRSLNFGVKNMPDKIHTHIPVCTAAGDGNARSA